MCRGFYKKSIQKNVTKKSIFLYYLKNIKLIFITLGGQRCVKKSIGFEI